MRSQLTNREFYIVLEPYIFLRKKEEQLLLYNYLDGSYIHSDDPDISSLFITHPSKMHLYKIETGEWNSHKINSFINKIESNQFGRLIEQQNRNQVLPIQFSPSINIQCDRDVTLFEFSRSDKSLLNFTEITIHLNSSQHNESLIDKIGFKQFVCPYTESTKNELDFKEILRFISPCLDCKTLKVINFSGWQFDRYSGIDDLFNFIESYDAVFNFYCSVNDHLDFIKQSEFLALKSYINFKIIVSPILKAREKKVLNSISQLPNIHFNFIIRSSEDYYKFENLIKELQISQFSFLPLFDGTNTNFFYESVFIEKDDILGQKNSLNDIHSNLLMNPLNFGKLTIKSTGDIYANVNDGLLGNIFENNVYEIVYKEIKFGNSWFNCKANVSPCQDCIYDFLCTPISNYEYALGRNNLCTII